MRASLYAICAAVTIWGSQSAYAYDDPAVAVCEYTRFHGLSPTKLGYSRTKAEVDGSLVNLIYEKSVLNTAPRKTPLTCAFRKTGDGRFVLKRSSDVNPEDEQVKRCRDIVTEGQKQIDQGKLDISDTAIVRTRMSMCDRTLGIDPNADAMLNQIDQDLEYLGIYPISQSDTLLK